MPYYELPNKKKHVVVTVVTVLTYVVIFFLLRNDPLQFSDDIKLALTQGGLMVVFISVLVGSMGIFWSEKVSHNRNIAIQEIESYEFDLQILMAQEDQLKIDLSVSISQISEKLEYAQKKLQEVEDHPEFLFFSGRMSILVLGIGTWMCILGA